MHVENIQERNFVRITRTMLHDVWGNKYLGIEAKGEGMLDYRVGSNVANTLISFFGYGIELNSITITLVQYVLMLCLLFFA